MKPGGESVHSVADSVGAPVRRLLGDAVGRVVTGTAVGGAVVVVGVVEGVVAVEPPPQTQHACVHAADSVRKVPQHYYHRETSRTMSWSMSCHCTIQIRS